MDGTIWFLLGLIVALILLGVMVAGLRRRPPQVNQAPGHCPRCRTPISLRRVSILRSHLLLGEWVCPHCGTRMDKFGKSISGTAN
jgi:hypothetical protein